MYFVPCNGNNLLGGKPLLKELNKGTFGEAFFNLVSNELSYRKNEGINSVKATLSTEIKQVLYIEDSTTGNLYFIPWYEFMLLQRVCLTKPKKIEFKKREGLFEKQVVGLAEVDVPVYEIEFMGIYE